MKRQQVRFGRGLALILALAGVAAWGLACADSARAGSGAVNAMAAAVTVEFKDAKGTPLREVNGVVLPQGVVIQVSALSGASSAEVHARDGSHWTSQNIVCVHPVLGLAMLEMPQVPSYALSFPATGSFTPSSRVTVVGGPGSHPDSLSATVYFSFSLRDGTDYVSVYPGMSGAAAVVDPTGRFLGVMTDLSAGGIACWSVVPMVSVRALAGAAGAPVPIAQQNDISPPPYEDPTSAVGLTFRAASLVTANKFEDARVFLNSAIKKDPKAEDPHFWLARIHFTQQKYVEAAEEFQKAGAADPTYHMAWHMAGAAYNQAGRYLDAEKMYAKALEANPRSAETYCNLGGAYYNEHRYEKAIEAFRKSISLDPQYQRGLAYNNLAMTYKTQGNQVEAEKVYQDLAQVNADWAKRLRDLLDGKKTN